jgi:hypothetical protein
MFRDVSVPTLTCDETTIVYGAATWLAPEPLTYARGNATGSAVISPSGNGNIWLLRDGEWARLNRYPAYGAWCAVIDERYCAWQELGITAPLPAGACVLRMDLATGEIEDLRQIQVQAEGLLDLVNGQVRTCDRSQPFTAIRRDGSTVTLTLWMTRGSRTVGQANSGGPGVQVYDAADDTLYRVMMGDMQTPPRLSDDGKTVAVNDPNGGFFGDTSWTIEPALPPMSDLVRLTQPAIFGAFTK